MSLELIKQTLSPNDVPKINGVNAERRVSKAVLENMFQGLVHTEGKGITEKFTTQEDVDETAQIAVLRVLPNKSTPREQGASKNGGSYSNKKHYSQTVQVQIDLLTTIDDPIDVPGSRQRMISVDLLAKNTENFSKRLNTIINGGTIASHLLASYKEDMAGKEYNHVDITREAMQNKEVAEVITDANELLDGGDMEHGVDQFPQDDRIVVVRVGGRSILKHGGVLVIGGSNYAQEILAGKGISPNANTKINENGYIGDIDGTPVHVISNESVMNADGFLGFPQGTLLKSKWFGIVSSAMANARGVSVVKEFKIVDAQAGQGLILQPFVKMGMVAWYPKGNVIITKEATSEHTIFARLKPLFTCLQNGTAEIRLKAEGSRLFPTFERFEVSTTSITTTISALDDNDIDHAKEGYYVIAKKPVGSVEEFLDVVDAGVAKKGKLTTLTGSTNITSASAQSKDYISILAIADDGSLSLKTAQIA